MKNRHTPTTLKGLLAAALVAAAAATAPAQTASTTYRASQRDPFSKYKPPVKRKVDKRVVPVAPPPIQARIDNYKAQKQAAMSRQQAAPKPTTALLLAEAQVKGIFRTPRGYAAMVYATPIKLSYVVYPGEQFYDGMLVAIEESRLVFRKQTKMSDGKTVVAVETKPLVQPTVADQLTAQREAEEPAAPAAEEKKSEVTQLIEALKALAAAGAQQQTNASAGGTAPGADAQPAPPEGKP
jgi:hypothetical protein